MSKYGNRKTVIDGLKFDSAKEAARYCELKLLMAAGLISNLEVQPCFELQPAFKRRDGKKERAIQYVGDFQYLDGGKTVVEDVKGFKTQSYSIKKKLFLYRYPHITFLET